MCHALTYDTQEKQKKIKSTMGADAEVSAVLQNSFITPATKSSCVLLQRYMQIVLR